MLLKVTRHALMILLALLPGRAAPAALPEGAEQAFTPDRATNQFTVAAKEGCCKVWILIKGGDTATKLNRLYGNDLVPLNAKLQLESWFPVDFAKLSPQWQTAIRDKLAKTQGHRSADQLTSDESSALTSSPEGTDGEAPSQPLSPQVTDETSSETGGYTPTVSSSPMLSTGLWSLLSVLLLMIGILLGRLLREARYHSSSTAIMQRIEEALELLKEEKASEAERKLREDRAAADEREKLAQALAQVTKFNPAMDLLHMAQQIAEVVTKAGEQDPSSATAQPWTIFTWWERWNALLEERRSGELVRAKEVLRRNFGDLDFSEFIGKVAGVLSVMRGGRSDTVDPRGVPMASMALSDLASFASSVTKELADHSGLSAEESLDKHLQKIRDSLLGLSLREYLIKMAGDLERLELSVGEGAEAKRQLVELKGTVDNAQELLYGAGFWDGDLFQGLQAMVRERDQVRANLRELAGEDGSGSVVEVMERVKQQFADVRSEAQKARSKFARWADWWRRLASALGYRVVDHEPDERPPATALQTSGAWWDLRLGFLIMLKGWPAEVANVPPEVREHLRIGEVHRGARELVGLLEDLAGQEARGDEGDKMWDLLKLKAVAINGIVRSHEFLRTYYSNSAPAFRHRLAIGVSALELAFAAARARLVKVELLSLASVDPSLFDVEHMDEDLRPLEGPRAKIPERLARAKGGGFPVDMVACAFERKGDVAVRGRVELVTPGTWIEFLPRAPSDA